MSPLKVFLSTSQTLRYPQGGHLWVFLNWAYGLASCGCEVTWLDLIEPEEELDEIAEMKVRLQEVLPFKVAVDYLSESQQAPSYLNPPDDCDFLLDLRYNTPQRILRKARKTALLDIDPVLYQIALKAKQYPHPVHDYLFSIGNVPGWIYCPPVIAIEKWPLVFKPSGQWTTVAHWWGGKRDAFMDYMDIPKLTSEPITLALCYLTAEEEDRLHSFGFRTVDSHRIAGTLSQYQHFIQNSRGEFSLAKHTYVSSQAGWLSDRTLCYLASGKPCIVQHTGAIGIMSEPKLGLLRFTSKSEAIRHFARVSESYEEHSSAAREIVLKHFDASRICARLLDQVKC